MSQGSRDWEAILAPQPFIILGLLGLPVLTVLASTFNLWATRRLRKYWKRLHRLVYPAGLTVVFHAILATTASKKVYLRDPQAEHELKLYVALLVVLLVMRIPLVGRVLKQISDLLRHRRKADLPFILVAIPDSMPEFRPKLNGRQASIPSDNLLTEVYREQDGERLQVP